jgi:hypothetical protein
MRDMPKHLLATLLLGALLLSVTGLTAAQEAAAETSASAPGISTLIFLLGAGAILVVGGAMIARDSFRADGDDKAS